jgi:hypothetical protein
MGTREVKWTDNAWNDYVLGSRLAELSQPGDLVIVSGGQTGSPVAIYYSRRHGWVFSPPPIQANCTQYMEDDEPAIKAFEDLRRRGADWFAAVRDSRVGRGHAGVFDLSHSCGIIGAESQRISVTATWILSLLHLDAG